VVDQIIHEFENTIRRGWAARQRQALSKFDEAIGHGPLLQKADWIKDIARERVKPTVLSVLLPMLMTMPKRTVLRYSGTSRRRIARGNSQFPSFHSVWSEGLVEGLIHLYDYSFIRIANSPRK